MSTNIHSRYVPALSFNWLTPYYDTVVRATTREHTFKQALIQQAQIRPRHEVLDLACGTGTLAIWVKQQEPRAEVSGVDGDARILAIARQKAHSANVQLQLDQGLSHDLPYASARFDRILCSLFFHHLNWDTKLRTAQELFRVLKPGAEFHVADWGRPTGSLMRALYLPIQFLDGFENTQDNVEGRLPELFQQVGFSEVARGQTFATMFGTMALYSARKAG
jgi:ubiquinone/menaquinone biosynthesis C-methylase UbiE